MEVLGEIAETQARAGDEHAALRTATEAQSDDPDRLRSRLVTALIEGGDLDGVRTVALAVQGVGERTQSLLALAAALRKSGQ